MLKRDRGSFPYHAETRAVHRATRAGTYNENAQSERRRENAARLPEKHRAENATSAPPCAPNSGIILLYIFPNIYGFVPADSSAGDGQGGIKVKQMRLPEKHRAENATSAPPCAPNSGIILLYICECGRKRPAVCTANQAVRGR